MLDRCVPIGISWTNHKSSPIWDAFCRYEEPNEQSPNSEHRIGLILLPQNIREATIRRSSEKNHISSWGKHDTGKSERPRDVDMLGVNEHHHHIATQIPSHPRLKNVVVYLSELLCLSKPKSARSSDDGSSEDGYGTIGFDQFHETYLLSVGRF